MKSLWIIIFLSLYINANIIKLTKGDINLLKEELALLESNGNINAENSKGYLGKYQFGASALSSIGLVNETKYKSSLTYSSSLNKRVWKKGLNNKSFLLNANNWLIPHGKKSFLGNSLIQENAMDTLINLNYSSLLRTKRAYSKGEIMGFLMAAHLGGVSHAHKYINTKKEFRDGFGTRISKYYKVGFNLSTSKTRKDLNELTKIAKAQLGKKYVWGGTTPKGFDCSGYTKYIFKKLNISIPRTALNQSKVGEDVSIEHLKNGDLLFFLTDKSRNIPITHVGIYLGEGNFIHAASKKEGVIISKLDKYKSRFVSAKRVQKSSEKKKTIFRYANSTAYHYKIVNGKYMKIN